MAGVGRPKGQKKTGGRKKGTPNKISSDTRTWLNNLINNNKEQIEKDLQSLEPCDRLRMFEKFLQYTTPKISNVKQSISFDNLTDEQLNEIINEIIKNIEQ